MSGCCGSCSCCWGADRTSTCPSCVGAEAGTVAMGAGEVKGGAARVGTSGTSIGAGDGGCCQHGALIDSPVGAKIPGTVGALPWLHQLVSPNEHGCCIGWAGMRWDWPERPGVDGHGGVAAPCIAALKLGSNPPIPGTAHCLGRPPP